MTLREYLTEKNLTYAEFGKKLGVSGNTIARYVNGLRKPSFAIMQKIIKTTKNKINHESFKGE